VESELALVESFRASGKLKSNTLFRRDCLSNISDIKLSLFKIDEFVFDDLILIILSGNNIFYIRNGETFRNSTPTYLITLVPIAYVPR